MKKIKVIYHDRVCEVELYGSSTVLELLNRAFGLEQTVALNDYKIDGQPAEISSPVTEANSTVSATAK